jgi:hypothetical protein
MTWVCDIPGATATTSAWHLALHAGLAVLVVATGVTFLAFAIVAYRRPVDLAGSAASDVTGSLEE